MPTVRLVSPVAVAVVHDEGDVTTLYTCDCVDLMGAAERRVWRPVVYITPHSNRENFHPTSKTPTSNRFCYAFTNRKYPGGRRTYLP